MTSCAAPFTIESDHDNDPPDTGIRREGPGAALVFSIIPRAGKLPETKRVRRIVSIWANFPIGIPRRGGGIQRGRGSPWANSKSGGVTWGGWSGC